MPKTFYLIDGHAQIYRAYFAPFRDLTGPNGEPTKATFVFTQRLLNLIHDRKPDYLAMVIDGSEEEVFRKEIYPQYKANRAKRPDDFGPQEQRILQIVRDMGIPIFHKDRFEADDVLATMAKRLCGTGFETVIVSNDKDLRQIINDCTRLYDLYNDAFTDAASMEAKLGYTPAEAIDVQTLVGDSIDNVEGIPGVGEKTAAKLVRKYGSAQAILQHLDELTPKLRENFQTHQGKMALARQLVTLRTDVEIDFDPEACRFTGINTEALRKHLESLGFHSLLKKIAAEAPGLVRTSTTTRNVGSLPAGPTPKRKTAKEAAKGAAPEGGDGGGLFAGMATAAAPAAEPLATSGPDAPAEGAAPAGPGEEAGPAFETAATGDYRLVDTQEKFDAFLAELRRQTRFAFDTETDDLGAMKSNVIGLSFSWKHAAGYYVPVRGPEGSTHLPPGVVLNALKPVLEDAAVKKVGHNIKYDLLVMRQAGVTLRGIEMDSMIAAWLIDASRTTYGIDGLARDLLNYQKIATVDLIGRGKSQISMNQVPLERVAAYASEDADISLRLADLLAEKIKELPAVQRLGAELEYPLIDVLAEMEYNGVAIDPAILKEQSLALGERIEKIREEIFQKAGVGEFNIDSPKQLQGVLFDKLKLPVQKKTKTGPSTDVEVLDRLSDKHPVPKLILEYRGLVKLKNTYLDNLAEEVNPKTGRVHGHFNQTGAATGRLSMSDPNLQNIPIRTDEGRRIRLAFVSGDPRSELLTADYSQIELRLLTHFTREPALVKAFEEDQDVHATVASEVFNTPLDQVTRQQRGYAKTINFGIIYGVSAYGLARRIEGLSVAAAAELIEAYNQRFPSIQKFMDQSVMHAQTLGYVETILGRRRPIININSGVTALSGAAERAAANTVVQGSAADLIKVAMLSLHRRLLREKRPSKLCLQVHDELVFETPKNAIEEDSAIIREEMVNALKDKLTVPLKVDIGHGKNWQEGK